MDKADTWPEGILKLLNREQNATQAVRRGWSGRRKKREGHNLTVMPSWTRSCSEQTDDYTLLGPIRAVNSGLVI
jgi:hypothetical protein